MERKLFHSTFQNLQLYIFVYQSFRHDFDIADVKINSLHGAETRAEATRNLQFFFPEEHIFVILKPNLTDQQRCKYKSIEI